VFRVLDVVGLHEIELLHDTAQNPPAAENGEVACVVATDAAK
jgi:hypothetical protein